MRRLLAALSATLALATVVVAGQTAHAAFDPFQKTCIESGGKSSVCEDSKKGQDADGSNAIYGKDGILTKAITILNILIGVISVIMIIIGGFKFVTSGGDSNHINSARNTVIYALVGIVVAISGQLIVKFVLNRL